MCVLLVFECFCRFIAHKPNYMKLEDEVEGLDDQGNLQRRPKMTQHRQNLRPKSKHQESIKRGVEEALGPDWQSPPQPVWVAHGPATHGRACPVSYGVFLFFVPLRFPVVFAVFLLIMLMYLHIWGYPIQPHSILHSIFLVWMSFSERKWERWRVQGFRIEFVDWEIEVRVLDEQFFPLSSLFSF